jgi:hypothetical protein
VIRIYPLQNPHTDFYTDPDVYLESRKVFAVGWQFIGDAQLVKPDFFHSVYWSNFWMNLFC